jgi:hypothetical protein
VLFLIVLLGVSLRGTVLSNTNGSCKFAGSFMLAITLQQYRLYTAVSVPGAQY